MAPFSKRCQSRIKTMTRSLFLATKLPDFRKIEITDVMFLKANFQKMPKENKWLQFQLSQKQRSSRGITTLPCWFSTNPSSRVRRKPPASIWSCFFRSWLLLWWIFHMAPLPRNLLRDLESHKRVLQIMVRLLKKMIVMWGQDRMQHTKLPPPLSLNALTMLPVLQMPPNQDRMKGGEIQRLTPFPTSLPVTLLFFGKLLLTSKEKSQNSVTVYELLSTKYSKWKDIVL